MFIPYITLPLHKMADQSTVEAESSGNIVTNFIAELLSSPLNIALLGLCGFLLYKIISGQKKHEPAAKKDPDLPKMKQQDMTLEQLREFDGKGPEGRILLAANGKIFDVTRGKRFYGPGKNYFCLPRLACLFMMLGGFKIQVTFSNFIHFQT